MHLLSLHKKWHARFLLCLLIGASIGFLVVHLGGKDFINQFSLSYVDRLKQLKTFNIDTAKLFFVLFYKREILLLLFACIGLTSIGKNCMTLALTWLGISLSVLMACAVKLYSAKGVLLFAAVLFPHGLIYLAVCMFGYYFIYFFSQKSGWQLYKKNILRQPDFKIYIRYIFSFLLLAILILIGVLLEAFVNPWLIKKALTFL